ncbi:uncharacterized protein AC631_05716 [Debaryomyces fabryi]|uniref:glucan endo-1,3-beta-D-glucosidase n=1 Tax=Debaryomyces fabryi TaxID=58627 RepID=A0A0V1PR75_9ASCO|nr:uncharacterized protein AC631_05716 [Debaryomyces fabryi]KRZ98526.1 hypothetical protein AC631_05716 [Debaryomyces fabryi]CUM45909.1 unnamed protein product [Debaryomyces fabryi]
MSSQSDSYEENGIRNESSPEPTHSEPSNELNNKSLNKSENQSKISKFDESQKKDTSSKISDQMPSGSNETLSNVISSENIDEPLHKFKIHEGGPSGNNRNPHDELAELNQYIENYKIDAVSPLSNETQTLASPQESPPIPEVIPKGKPPFIKSKLLDPIGRYPDGRFLNTIFQNSAINSSKKDKAEPRIQGETNLSNSSSLLNEKDPNWLQKNKHRVTYSSLFLLILLLLSCFIPIIVTLYNGTQHTVHNYFRMLNEDERLRMFKSLIHDYGNLDESNITRMSRNRSKGADLAGYNTLNGINPKYRNDPEIVSLMSDKEFFGTIFYGLGYAPRDAMEPRCGVSKREILLDLSLISKVTTRIRNYGMQCNQSDFILDSIQDLQLNMTLAMGVWIGSNETTNAQQITWMKELLQKYPRELFECIFIGNEVLFREEQTSKSLSEYIEDARSFAQEIGYNDLPIGTSEIGSLIDKTLLKSCDIIGANVHPFFSGGDVETASQWAFDFVKYQIEPLNEGYDTEIIITEVGWPYKGGEYEAAVADPKSFQIFLNDWVCDAYENNYGWYYFEAFDEPWKKIFYEDGNKWETEWGVFTKSRNHKKNILLPNC